MESALLAGDYIMVNKMIMGARIFNVFEALDKKEVAIYRIPGWGNIKRNDVIVFNFPYPNRWDSIGFNVMTYYAKRCIALPGDTLEIKDCFYKIKGINGDLGNLDAQKRLSKIENMRQTNIVYESYPQDSLLNWNIKNFGPLYVPRKGNIIYLDERNRILYGKLIEWEQKQKIKHEGGHFYLGNQKIAEYRFKKNYYFVSGDKMENSKDSRYWGLLPEEFIVGKAWLVWKSVDTDTGSFRWERFLKRIK